MDDRARLLIPKTTVPGIDHSVLKIWLWLRQDGQCFLCGEPIDMTVPRNRYGACSAEHLQPRIRGGTDARGNLAATHWECNKKRGTGTWLKQMRPPPDARIGAYVGHRPSHSANPQQSGDSK